MNYNIKLLRDQEIALENNIRQHFEDFFRQHDYSTTTPNVLSFDIKTPSDVDKVRYGVGFYLILTNYKKEENSCSFEIDAMKAIYRGHCCTVKSRIQSHLLNNLYREKTVGKKHHYNVCMKLDGNNGINFTEKPYCKYRWRIVFYKMEDSTKLIREQAELAFDSIFSRPFASRERSKQLYY